MTPDENKQVVRDSIKVVWIDHNIDALPKFWTTDCINHAMLNGSDNRGLDVLRTYHEQFGTALSALSNVHIEILQQIAEEDTVVTQLLTTARHTGLFMGVPATGRAISLATIRIDRLQIGKIAEHWSVADVAGLMQQLQ